MLRAFYFAASVSMVGVEFIDENDGGPGGTVTKAIPEKELGRATQQKDRPSRSEAIRRLIEIAPTTKSKR